MKMDPADVCTVWMDLKLGTTANTIPDSLLYSLWTYLDYVDFEAGFPGDGEAKYISELLSKDYSDGVIRLTLRHYDSEKAMKAMKYLLSALKDRAVKMEAFGYKPVLILQRLESCWGEDADIANRQNDIRNTQQYYSDLETAAKDSIVSFQQAKEEYAKTGKPAGYGSSAPHGIKKAILWTMAGALLGFLLFAAMELLKYVFNDYIYSPEDMEELGINALRILPEKENVLLYDFEAKEDPMRLLAEHRICVPVFRKGKVSVEKAKEFLELCCVFRVLVPGGILTE